MPNNIFEDAIHHWDLAFLKHMRDEYERRVKISEKDLKDYRELVKIAEEEIKRR